jgi:hypothetical protein
MIIMNPASNETAGLQLPIPEQSPKTKAAEKAAMTEPAPAEQAPMPSEKSLAGQQSAPLPPMTLPLPPAMPQANPINDNSTTTQASPSAIVDDGDLIEKEWVHKAKQIVEANRDDPYKQSEELTVFKADYMKKRYGKNIKLSK